MSSTTTGGLLAQASNIGAFENNEFSSVIEVGVGVRRRISCRLSTTFGYDFVHMSDVVRAGNIIDRQINTSQIPPSELTGTARPAFNFDIGGFWAQGLRWGLEYNY